MPPPFQATDMIKQMEMNMLNMHRQNQENTHTHSILTAIFPREPGLAGCPLNSPFPIIPGLRIFLGQA